MLPRFSATRFGAALLLVYALAPIVSFAQGRASVSTVGVGVDGCSQVIAAVAADESIEIADVAAKLAAHTQYRSWHTGWLSGYSLGSVDGGLGAIDLTLAPVWYFDVLATCRTDPAATFSSAVAQVTDRFPTLRVSGGVRRAGFGDFDCLELIENLTRPDVAHVVLGFANYTYGFLSGYNAFRTQVGLATLDLADGEDPFAWTTNYCRRNSAQHVGSTVSVWVLEAEARQDAPPILRNAQSSRPAAVGEVANSIGDGDAAPFIGLGWLSHVGSRTCEMLTRQFSPENRVASYSDRIAAMSWTAGYLTASDRFRSRHDTSGIDLSRVEPQAFWNAIRERCRHKPDATLAAVTLTLELRRLYPPTREISSLVGFGHRSCGELRAPSRSEDREDAFSETVDSLDLERGVPGWIEGFLSAYNMAIFDGRLIAAPLNLADVGERGFEVVRASCTTNGELAVIDGVIDFVRASFPGLPLQ
jgi:hypothetical protein